MPPERIVEGVPHILGRYQLLHQKLGSGTYATVVEAVHMDLKVHVAIKIIDTSKIRDEYVIRHLAREAALLRRLAHPNVIAVFESMRAGPLYCLVSELVTGGELSAYVSSQPDGHLSEPQTMRFAGQLLSALGHMHERGVVHRDLKMRNILLNRTHDFVKVVDFGLSNVWSAESPLRTHCGSPGYAAPEIYVPGRAYGPEVDLWSLGVVLFGMAVGRLPFQTSKDKTLSHTERRRRMIAQISRGASESHLRAMEHFSPLFRDLVLGLLTAKVDQRLTVKEATLHPWLKSRPAPCRTYRLSARESGFIFSQLSIMLNMPVRAIEEQCREKQLGCVGAAYNIMAYQQLSTYHVGRDPDRLPNADYDKAFAGPKNEETLQSSINDVLQSGVESSEYPEISTPLNNPKKRISRLSVEPISLTVVAPSWTTDSPQPEAIFDEPSKPSGILQSPSPCCKSAGFGREALTPRLPKTPKSVSFSLVSNQESFAKSDRSHSQNGKLRSATSVATSTKETVHRSVQTTSKEDIVNSSCTLENPQKNPANARKNNSTHVGQMKVSNFRKKQVEPDSESRKPVTTKPKSMLSSNINQIHKKRTRVPAKNKHTSKRSGQVESSCQVAPRSEARSPVNLLHTPRFIRENSLSGSLMNSACPTEDSSCSTEIKENSENNQSNQKGELKLLSKLSSDRKNHPTRFAMDVPLQKFLGKADYISFLPLRTGTCHRSQSRPTSKTNSKHKCQQKKASTSKLEHKKEKGDILNDGSFSVKMKLSRQHAL